MKKTLGLLIAMSIAQLSESKLLNNCRTEKQRTYYREFEKKNKKYKRK